MLATFSTAFASTFLSVLDIFLVILAAGLLVRFRVLRQDHVTALSTATVDLFLPCLIFSKLLARFDPSALPFWWALPLAGIVMSLIALGLAAAAFARDLPEKRNMLPLASMQNAGYLVLPVGLALYPTRFDTFALYCFLFILGFSPVLWSLGKLLVTQGSEGSNGWRGLITPPLVANLAGVAAAWSGAARVIPRPVLHGIDLLGQAAVPVATVVLGAVLGSIRPRTRSYLADAVRVLGVKLVALPLLTIFVVHTLGLEASHPLLARFLVIEASAAPAAGLILQVRSWGGDERKVGSLMLASYISCCFTLPLWLAVWELVIR
jgi:malate permease and related proteins